MLSDFRFLLGVDCLLQLELVTGDLGCQRINPSLSEEFEFLRPCSVLDENTVLVRVDVRDIDIYRNDALLNLRRESRRKGYDGVLLSAISRTVSVTIDLSRNQRVECTVF